MHYRPDEEKYTQILTKFIDKENPPKNILLFEIRNKKVVENIIDEFPTTNFYVIDEPYFLNILTDERYRGGKYFNRVKGFEKVETKIPTPTDETEKLLKGLESILNEIEGKELTVIMNPPYGAQSGCLVRKIINVTKDFCEELIVLSPIRALRDQLEYIKNIEYLGNLSSIFPGLSCPAISIGHIGKEKVFKYKNLIDLRLTKKQKVFKDAVQRYNNTHPTFYKGLHGYCTPDRKNKELMGVDEKLLFVITNWCPYDKVHRAENVGRVAEDVKHNIYKEPINWNPKSSIYTIEFEDDNKIHNFTKWFYKTPGKSTEAKKTLIYMALSALEEGYNGCPSIHKYPEIFPNLDWSRPWTDEEIIQELKAKAGLPQDWSIN